MATEFKIVDVWVGNFKSRYALDDYLKETYDEENENTPVSLFAGDQEQMFCDHDFVKAAFRKLSGSFQELCDGLPCVQSWGDAAGLAFNAAGIAQANTVLLAFGRTIHEPRSVIRLNHKLTYLGRFESQPDGDNPVLEVVPVPEFIYLQMQGGMTLTIDGQQTTVLPVDQRGLMLGSGGTSDNCPCLDLSPWLSGCTIAEHQAKIVRDQFHQWSFEDLGNNGQTRVTGHAFDGLKTFPWHDQQISIGNLSFRWLNRVAGY